MTDNPHLSTDTWTELCDELEPVTASEQPYERIRVSPTTNDDGELVAAETFSAYVEEPFPSNELPDEIPDDFDWGALPSNDIIELSPSLSDRLWASVDPHRNAFSVSDPDIDVRLNTAVLTPSTQSVVYTLSRSLERGDAGLYDQFRDLMVTLDHVDDPERITHGRELAPIQDSLSDHDLDLGMGATAYMLVENPHEYWRDCDTLDDYIDMCVENGADRSKLEAQSQYAHHFHPDTRFKDLASTQLDAIKEWDTALRDQFEPFLTVHSMELWHNISRCEFNDEGDAFLTYSIAIGDDFPDES